MWGREKKEEVTPVKHLDADQLKDLQTIDFLRENMNHLDAMKLQKVISEKQFRSEKQIIINSIRRLEEKYDISD